jgi:hypothetical protein
MPNLKNIPDEHVDTALNLMMGTDMMNDICVLVKDRVPGSTIMKSSVFAHIVLILAYLLASGQIQLRKRI